MGVGSLDPRLNGLGVLDYRLTTLFRAWQAADEPPIVSNPYPSLSLLALCTSCTWLTPLSPLLLLIVSPWASTSYYAQANTSTHLFGRPMTYFSCRTSLSVWAHAPSTCSHAPFPILPHPRFVSLLFTCQKNGVRNKTIGHGRTGDSLLCPVMAVALWAPLPPPLFNAVALPPLPTFVTSAFLTAALRATLLAFPDPAFTAADLSACSTRAGGAMALLCAGVNSDGICLIGQWKSDEMYRYLHVQAQPLMSGLSSAMLRGGRYWLNPPSLPPAGPLDLPPP